MKRTKVTVTIIASAAMALSLMSTAFAAPATPAKNCPTKNLLNQLIGTNGTSLPTTGSALPSNLQGLLNQFGTQGSGNTDATTGSNGTNQPTTGSALPSNLQDLLNQGSGNTGATPKKNCPKKQASQPTSPVPSSTSNPTGTPAPTATPAPSPAPVSGNMSADEQKMVNLVNQDRAANGLPALTFDSGLRAGALAHSQDMSENNYFSHTSPTQGDFTARIRAAGVQYTSAGENIAQYGSVESAETGFMNSPGHRANILGNFTRVGIGIVYNESKGAYYITQWFAK